MKAKSGKSYAGYIVAAILLCIVAAIMIPIFIMREAAAPPGYGPEGMEATEDDGFPVIDWNHWKAANPNVCGWITIPGTGIDHPIMKPPDGDPDYYLTHDINENWNVYGAIFVDATCPEELASKNAVILGHHMNDGSMFAEIASYGNEEWAREHRTVLLQTPEWKRAVDVYAAEVVAGWNPVKVTNFENGRQFREYIDERLDACSMKLVDLMSGTYPDKMVTLVTCSYTTFDNERTLAYAW